VQRQYDERRRQLGDQIRERRIELLPLTLVALTIAFRSLTLLRRNTGDDDEQPHEPAQGKQCNASRTPVDDTQRAQAQPDEAGDPKYAMHPSVNSHRAKLASKQENNDRDT
jgi:hypothetical protein